MNIAPSHSCLRRREDVHSTQLIDEAERLATFDQSRRTRAGQPAAYLSPYSARVTRAPAGGIAGTYSADEDA